MTNNASVVLREAIPDVPAVGRDFLEYLFRHNDLDGAEAASVPIVSSAGAADRELLLRYTDRMADAGHWNAALLAWNALCDRKVLPYQRLDREHGPWENF